MNPDLFEKAERQAVKINSLIKIKVEGKAGQYYEYCPADDDSLSQAVNNLNFRKERGEIHNFKIETK